MPARSEPHAQKVLPAFVGFHDPLCKSAVEAGKLKGNPDDPVKGPP